MHESIGQSHSPVFRGHCETGHVTMPGTLPLPPECLTFAHDVALHLAYTQQRILTILSSLKLRVNLTCFTIDPVKKLYFTIQFAYRIRVRAWNTRSDWLIIPTESQLNIPPPMMLKGEGEKNNKVVQNNCIQKSFQQFKTKRGPCVYSLTNQWPKFRQQNFSAHIFQLNGSKKWTRNSWSCFIHGHTQYSWFDPVIFSSILIA